MCLAYESIAILKKRKKIDNFFAQYNCSPMDSDGQMSIRNTILKLNHLKGKKVDVMLYLYAMIAYGTV